MPTPNRPPQPTPLYHPSDQVSAHVPPHLVRRVEAFLRAIDALPPGEYPITITREQGGFRWDGLPPRQFPPRNIP